MTTRPWQYEWKRPQWQSPIDASPTSDQTPSLGAPLCSVSAQVVLEEFPNLTHNCNDEDERGVSFVLTVSLFSSQNDDNVGDVVLLELIKYETSGGGGESTENNNNSLERICMRTLRWPGAALNAQQENDDNEKVHNEESQQDDESSNTTHVKPWYTRMLLSKKKRQRKELEKVKDGLVAVALCRRPPPSPSHTAVDALDAVSMMSLGLGVSVSAEASSFSLQQNVESKDTDSTGMQESDYNTDLVLVCLTSKGNVHIYNAPPLFEKSVSEPEDQMMGALASLFLGNDVYHQVLASILPLSKPASTISLSIPIKTRNQRGAPNCKETLQEEHDEEAKNDAGGYRDEEEVLNWWDSSVWDSNVEPSSAKFRTVDNSPTVCAVVFDYVVVGGRGVRQRRRKRRYKKALPEKSNHSKTVEQNQDVQPPPPQPKPDTPTATDFSLLEESKTTTDLGNENTEWWDNPNSAAAAQSTAESPDWADAEHGEPSSPTNEWDKETASTRSSKQSSSKWKKYTETGGFITFLSLRHDSEVKTVYLPFAPKKLAPVVWGGMKFLLVLGDGSLAQYTNGVLAVAVRVDSSSVLTALCGDTPSLLSQLDAVKTSSSGSLLDEDALTITPSSDWGVDGGKATHERKQMCAVRRFRLVPIVIPSIEGFSPTTSRVSPMAVSSVFTTPPCIAVEYAALGNDGLCGDSVVALHSLRALELTSNTAVSPRGFWGFGNGTGLTLTIQTTHHPGHVARLPSRLEPDRSSMWCYNGQGWSLVGTAHQIFFVCWEGTTESSGAFVSEIYVSENPLGVMPSCSGILALHPFDSGSAVSRQARDDKLNNSVNLGLPFTSEYDTLLEETTPDGNKIEPLNMESGVDNTIVHALESISSLPYGEAGGVSIESIPPRRHRAMSLSHEEKSRRLYRHCSSWEQLENTAENRSKLGGQAPELTLRIGSQPDHFFVLSLRKIFLENGKSTPFDQVLSWLCQGQDYFTASSVALDLLGDVDSLRGLRQKMDSIADADVRLNLEGLLDGITPLDLGTQSDSQSHQLSKRAISTLTQLADMTVGCLVKGGLMMAVILEGFLERNKAYDPARTSLMLVATAACSLSGDKDVSKSVMGHNYRESDSDIGKATDLLWPVRCLLRVATSRDYLLNSMLLLNEAIPDELRSRPRSEQLSSSSPPPSLLCTMLVKLIISSSADAAGILLNLIDDESRKRYWSSLEHDAQLALALIEINGRLPLIREVEVRSWILKRVRQSIEAQGSAVAVPTAFLKQLCTACLRNAGCHMDGFRVDSTTTVAYDSDGVQQHLDEFRNLQDALTARLGSGGLDYDLLISALLLLQQRGEQWCDDPSISSQSLLDAACYLSGRKEAEEPVFAFDGPMAMKLCVMSGNVSAGANLIGGRDGLVLKCCDVLIKGAGMNMDDAEAFLLGKRFVSTVHSTGSKKDDEEFTLKKGHRHILWLLDEHVLSVKTYGEFESSNIRGRVDPVFAARSCLRTWHRLDESHCGTPWLVSWLQRRLGMDGDTASSKRLACAALTRALLWPDDNDDDKESDQVLATALDMEGTFLAQIAESCCGLVESIPPSLAKEFLNSSQTSPVKAGYKVPVDV